MIEANTLALKGEYNSIRPTFTFRRQKDRFPPQNRCSYGEKCRLKKQVLSKRICVFEKTRRQVKRLEAKQLPQEEAQIIKKDRTAVTTLAIILIALVITYLPVIMVGVLTETLPGRIAFWYNVNIAYTNLVHVKLLVLSPLL